MQKRNCGRLCSKCLKCLQGCDHLLHSDSASAPVLPPVLVPSGQGLHWVVLLVEALKKLARHAVQVPETIWNPGPHTVQNNGKW